MSRCSRYLSPGAPDISLQVLQISLYPTHNGRAHHTDAFSIVAEKQVASETSEELKPETTQKIVIRGFISVFIPFD